MKAREPVSADERHLAEILVRTELVTVGAFRCGVDDPLFSNSGPVRQYCFVFPRTAVSIAHEGRPPFVADPSIVTLYNEGQRYGRTPIAANGDRCDWYGVRESVLRDAVRRHDRGTADDARCLMKYPYARTPEHLYRRQRQIFIGLQRTPVPDPLVIEEGVIALLEDVLACAYQSPARPLSPEQRAARHRRDLAENAKRLIGRGVSYPWTLARLSRPLDCSPFHLCRAFRESTGSTLHAYLTSVRLRSALELVDAGLDLTTVALALGYSSHSHFTSAFRRAFGVSPSRAAAPALLGTVCRRAPRRLRARF